MNSGSLIFAIICYSINIKKAGMFIKPALNGIFVLINIPEIKNPKHPNTDIKPMEPHFLLLYLLYNLQTLILGHS